MVCTSMVVKDTTELSSELLDRVWVRFLESNGIRDFAGFQRRYRLVSRRSPRSQQFETWLFTQGATVKQRSDTRYLQFTDTSQAMMFALKYA